MQCRSRHFLSFFLKAGKIMGGFGSSQIFKEGKNCGNILKGTKRNNHHFVQLCSYFFFKYRYGITGVGTGAVHFWQEPEPVSWEQLVADVTGSVWLYFIKIFLFLSTGTGRDVSWSWRRNRCLKGCYPFPTFLVLKNKVIWETLLRLFSTPWIRPNHCCMGYGVQDLVLDPDI